LTSPEKTKIIQ
jgi:hypothetical protein